MRFRPEQHLRRPGDIRAVRERGRRVECRAFTLWWKHRDPQPVAAASAGASSSASSDAAVAATTSGSEGNHTPMRARRSFPTSPAPVPPGARVCVIASTAAVGAATRRARAKRRLREIFRHQQAAVPEGCDLLLVARAAITDWPMADLEKKFAEACRQIAPSPKPASAPSTTPESAPRAAKP